MCDLQHQSIQSNLTFDFQTYLPGLKHYPRVSYKKVILSPAKWLIPTSLYQQKTNHASENLAELQHWLKEKNINFLVKTGIADQTLCFNPTSMADLNALLSYVKQQGNRPIYLSEALIDEDGKVHDESGKKYHAEFVINYGHNEQLYQQINVPNALSIIPQKPIEKYYLPGSEWLFFEIFINPSKSNFLLLNEIHQLLKTYKRNITKWFFIRYDENGKHLRLRLQVKDVEKRATVIEHFNILLKGLIANGIIKDIALKTYYRELARYGAARIASVEQFFYLDSKYVLYLLSKITDKIQLYRYGISFMSQITTVCFPSFNERLHFIRQMAEAFGDEFNINKEGFKKINQAYVALKNEEEQICSLKQLKNQAESIFTLCTENEKSKLLADLIHMHINRIFNNQQRLHEAICYQFLYKYLLTEQARLTAQRGHQASA